MWMDFITASVFVFSTASGLRQGFVRTFFYSIRWLLSIILGYMLHKALYQFLRYKTGFYALVLDKVSVRVVGGSSAGTFVSDMPAILQETIEPIKNGVVETIASGITDFLFKLISFIVAVVLLRLIIMGITIVFSKKHNRNIIGFFDSVAGFLAGIIKGLLLIFLFLTFLVPIVGLFPDSFLISALESSKITSVLYDNNYLVLVIKNIF